jgi:pilus assembly protein CpaE
MLNAVIVCPDSHLREELEARLRCFGSVRLLRAFIDYPDSYGFTHLAGSWVPDVVFVSTESLDRALAAVPIFEREHPGIQVVGIDRENPARGLIEMIRAGVREFISAPFHAAELNDVLQRLSQRLQTRPPAEPATPVISFLPAKPGVGASTIALNTSVAMSRLQDRRVLLADLDLSAGMVQFMLKLTLSKSVKDAAERAHEMDEALWKRLVSSIGGLDVLPSGPIDPRRCVSAVQVRQLVGHCRSSYAAVCVDLSGNMEEHALEVLQMSEHLLTVCTPELASLHHAQQRMAFLKGLHLEGRVKLILNRWSKDAVVSAREVEEMVGAPVLAVIANDYRGVQKAIQTGQPVSSDSPMGKQIEQLAMSLIGAGPAKGPSLVKQVLKWLPLLSLNKPVEAIGTVVSTTN